MNNKEIKAYAQIKDVRLWQVADALGITDTTFSKKMRKEFTDDEKEKIKGIIDQLAEDGR